MFFTRIKKSFILLTIFLCSCSATPDIHLIIPGTNMEINQPARLAIGMDISQKNNQVLVGSGKFAFDLWDIEKGRKLKSFNMGRRSIKYAGSLFAVDVGFFQNGEKGSVACQNPNPQCFPCFHDFKNSYLFSKSSAPLTMLSISS